MWQPRGFSHNQSYELFVTNTSNGNNDRIEHVGKANYFKRIEKVLERAPQVHQLQKWLFVTTFEPADELSFEEIIMKWEISVRARGFNPFVLIPLLSVTGGPVEKSAVERAQTKMAEN
eukprot:Lankesteria_metandrocarpae@DN433_c1_g1_i1.p1